MSSQPKGWTTTALERLVEPTGVLADGDWVESKDQDPKGDIRLLQLADVGDGRFVNKSKRFVNAETFKRLRCTEVLPGDVLVARMPDPLGRACIAPNLPNRCITVVDVAIIRPGKSAHPKWLMHCLNAPAIRAVIDLQASGTTRRRISRSKLARLEIPLPPFSEQERIADKLDALLHHVDACRTRLDRVPALLKRFRHAILAAATNGDLTKEWRGGEPANWTRTQLAAVASDFSYGSAAKSARTGAVPVLRMGNIQDGRLQWNDLVYTSDPAEISKYTLHEGDVLFNRTNSPELVGKTAVYRGEMPAIYAGYLIRVGCSAQLLPDFLSYSLGSPRGRAYCWSVKSDGVSQSNINAKKLAAFEFDLPSIEEQTEIVARVESLFAFAESLETRFNVASAQLDRLTPALLAKAFRGELVPQDPNDESANVLPTPLGGDATKRRAGDAGKRSGGPGFSRSRACPPVRPAAN